MGCYSFLKVMMILFNTAIFLGGGVLLGVGIWVAVDGHSFANIFGSSSTLFVNVSYFLIAIGAVLVVLGFLGCCGAQKESKCLLLMFFSIVLIIFIAEIAAAVVALVYTSLAENILVGTVTPILRSQYGKAPEVTQIWNVTMSEVKCCGLTNYTDFTGSYYYTNHNQLYPPFCCNTTITTSCNDAAAHASNIQGCFQQLLSDIRKNAGVVGGVAAGICALEIAAMVVSMYLYCHMDKK